MVSSGGASTGAGATIVGESTVPKKSGVIATQAGSSKIMHPEEDLSLVRDYDSLLFTVTMSS